MRLFCLSAILVCVLCNGASAAVFEEYAAVSCRTRSDYPDANRHDSVKLTVRRGDRGEKSWIKFTGLSGYDFSQARPARLRIVLQADKSGDQYVTVSAVNDDCLDNINWAESAITWNNAPGNDTTSFTNLNPAKTTVVGTVSFSNGLAGQAFYIDVLDILQADTDGIVQFVLHNPSNELNFSTHDHTSGSDYWPMLEIKMPPAGADHPIPAEGEDVMSLQSLSWTNPDPNYPGDPITCRVYLAKYEGSEPNRPEMDDVLLDANASSVAIDAQTFPNVYPLENGAIYYWVVDCYDPVKGWVDGEFWWFRVNVNAAPVVTVEPGGAVWLGKSGVAGEETAALTGTVTDDGLPKPFTVEWTKVAGPDAEITNSTSPIASVKFTVRGTYAFVLTANDRDKQTTSETVTYYVGADACDASHESTGAPYDPADLNQDCMVNLADFAIMAGNWMDCSDTLTQCL